jgi:hypothetical protein
MLGLVPLFGNDLWLHAGTAAIATYFGFLAKPDLLELREQGRDEQANPSR